MDSGKHEITTFVLTKKGNLPKLSVTACSVYGNNQ